jgi:hypothetical protein
MRHLKRVFTILPVLGLLLAGCAVVGPATYQGPAGDDQNAALVTAGTVAESYSVSQGSSWIQIVAVDGESSGPAKRVRVAPGEHRFTVRHFDGYATFYGNIRSEDVTFPVTAGGRYRIDASYCCGFILGDFDLSVVDEATGQQIAEISVSEQ